MTTTGCGGFGRTHWCASLGCGASRSTSTTSPPWRPRSMRRPRALPDPIACSPARGRLPLDDRLHAVEHLPPHAGRVVGGRFGVVVVLREGHAGSEVDPVSYTHLRAHETRHDLVC